LAALAEDALSTPEAAAKIVVPTEGHFAIQLITFQSVSRVESFAKEFGIVDNSRYMRVEENDRFLYSVLVGNYSTREEGRAAVGALSPQLRELDPWVRWLPTGTRLMSIEAPPEAASSE
jgi:septal ring-binding cell division protein DamX